MVLRTNGVEPTSKRSYKKRQELLDELCLLSMSHHQLAYIVRETLWMAQRYADGRSSYSTAMFNEALEEAFRNGVIERGSIPWAKDGMFGEWDENLHKFIKKEDSFPAEKGQQVVLPPCTGAAIPCQEWTEDGCKECYYNKDYP